MTTCWLFDCIDDFREKTAIVWHDQRLSYGQFRSMIDECLVQLAAKTVTAGESVALIGDYSPRSAAFLIALIANRNIAVPLTRGIVGDQRAQFLTGAEVETVVELDDQDCWTFSQRLVTRTAPLMKALRERGEPGLVVFSSGSTGENKAVLHSFDRLLNKFRQRRPGLRALVFLMPDHIGGINTLLGILTSGGTAVTASERTPDAVCQAIERWRVELLPTSPTFLNMLLMSQFHKKYDLSSLRVISYGTEPMPAATLKRVGEAFPGVRLKQLYGLSEFGILPSHSPNDVSLQIKLGGEGFETKVKNGTLWVRGPSAMLGYLNYPSPFDAEGWMDTGDLIEIDGDTLRVLGRKSEMINVGGDKVSPSEVEDVILQMDDICEVAVRGKPNPVTGNIVVARVMLQHQPEDPEELKERIQAFCAARLPRYKVPLLIEFGEVHQSGRFKKIRLEG